MPILDLLKSISTEGGLQEARSDFLSRDQSRAAWRQIFGNVSTERSEAYKQPRVRPPVNGGSWGRSMVSSDASYKRLLQAMRSMAPGGWSDDRWEQTKHFTGIAYVGIDRVSRQLQQAEFQVFLKDPSQPEGRREVSPADPSQGDRQCRPYDLVKLLQRPNRQDSFGKYMYRISQQQRLTGTALTWMVPNVFGVPYEIYVIPTAIAIPQPAVNPDYPDGYYRIQPVYPYGPFSSYPTPASAVGAPIPAQWMLRFQYPHPLLRYDGYSPLSAMRLHIDEVEAIDRSRWYKMKKGSNPDAVLNFTDIEGSQPLSEPEIERIHAEWENEQAGPENHGKLIVGTPGGKFEPWGASPRDMEYPTGWDQLTAFILGGAFGITKPAAGMIEDSSYATLFATLKQLHLITLEPDCNDYGSELTHHLAPFFGDDLIVEIRCKRIDDHEVNQNKVGIMLSGRLGTVNEARKLLDLPPTKEPWGSERLGEPPPQPEMMPGDEAGSEPVVSPSGAKLAKQDMMRGVEEDMEDEGTQRSRPVNTQGRGALGPRKHLVSSNGNGHYKR